MSSSPVGSEFSGIEVTNISVNGVWILVDDEEIFLSHEDYPWFKKATVEEVLELELVSPGHLYWPKLDVDLGINSIKEPQRFPLTASHNITKS